MKYKGNSDRFPETPDEYPNGKIAKHTRDQKGAEKVDFRGNREITPFSFRAFFRFFPFVQSLRLFLRFSEGFPSFPSKVPFNLSWFFLWSPFLFPLEGPLCSERNNPWLNERDKRKEASPRTERNEQGTNERERKNLPSGFPLGFPFDNSGDRFFRRLLR